MPSTSTRCRRLAAVALGMTVLAGSPALGQTNDTRPPSASLKDAVAADACPGLAAGAGDERLPGDVGPVKCGTKDAYIFSPIAPVVIKGFEITNLGKCVLAYQLTYIDGGAEKKASGTVQPGARADVPTGAFAVKGAKVDCKEGHDPCRFNVVVRH